MDWIGKFKYMFQLEDFYRVFKNSIVLSALRLVVGFPIPIILSLMLNEVQAKAYKKITQTAIYLPHFISWVVVGGILINFLSPTWGVVNELLSRFGVDSIFFMGEAKYFRSIIGFLRYGKKLVGVLLSTWQLLQE